jgi:hypothetical protein
MPPRCPSCGGALAITRLCCPACGAEVSGDFDMCPVCRLESGHRKMLELFLHARGNLREVQRALGVSYPTARQRVEELFRGLGGETAAADPLAVLRRLRAGEIGVDAAEKLLKGDS